MTAQKAPAKDKKPARLPDTGLYQLRVAKTFQRQEEDKFAPIPGTIITKVSFLLELGGTEDEDGDLIGLWHSFKKGQNVTYIKRTSNPDGSMDVVKEITKPGKFLRAIVGELPEELGFDQVDWEALEGTYLEGYVNHKEPSSKGVVYPEFTTFSPTKNAQFKNFNNIRRGYVITPF